ncbi:hypothetical protein [Nocardia sp. NPDC052566]|uniref:hypothetical protein n=1 Tax=Nocardia sp. NPDC052566 TaxID=3364330 RepID=UPI0037C4FFA9
MTKNGTQPWATAGDAGWTNIVAWTPNTGTYPGSSVVSDRLVVQGAKAAATVSAAAAFSGGSFARAHRIRLVDQTGAQIGTPGATVNADSGTCQVTATGVDLTGITSIGLQMTGTDNWCGTLANTGTALAIT